MEKKQDFRYICSWTEPPTKDQNCILQNVTCTDIVTTACETWIVKCSMALFLLTLF